MTALVNAYENLLLKNVATVNTVESGLRNLTWLLPGRFADAEVASEGLYALLSLVSSYHDTLLSKRLAPALSLPPHPFKPSTLERPTSASPSKADSTATPEPPRIAPLLSPISDHTRYTRYWTARSATYRRASRALATLSYVELLIEMVARKRGKMLRWKIVAGIEAFKTFLRFLILAITRRPVLAHPTPQREIDLATLPTVLSTELSSDPVSTSGSPTSTKPALLGVSPSAPMRSHLFPMAASLPESHLAHPLSLMPELSTLGDWSSEILAGCATLVHVLFLIREHNRRTTPLKPLSLSSLSLPLTPFAATIALRLLSRHLRTPNPSTPLQMQHFAAQDRALARTFFLTGPVWLGWTRPKIKRVCKVLERVPLVGLVGDFVEGYLPFVDEYFYYTSS